MTDDRWTVIQALSTTPHTCCEGCAALHELIAEVSVLRGEAAMAVEWMQQAEARRDEADALRSRVAQLRLDLALWQSMSAVQARSDHVD